MPDFITRFAPSPTGQLHLGHGWSARCAFGAARAAGGQCLLRIEDTDQTRCRPEFEDNILEDLAWLGHHWPTPVRRQSDYLDDYASALSVLREKNLVYRCFRTRREIINQIGLAPHNGGRRGPDGESVTPERFSPAEEREALKAAKPFAWRLSMAACKAYLGGQWDGLGFTEKPAGEGGGSTIIPATPEIFGDVILARKDTGTSYHLACVSDDARQAITHIIRGEDLFTVTHLHVLLQRLLDLPTPIYQHHSLLLDAQGKRFAKRDRAKTLQAMRKQGMTPDDINMMIDAHLKSQA